MVGSRLNVPRSPWCMVRRRKFTESHLRQLQSSQKAMAVVERIKKAVRLGQGLKPLNMFITETFAQATAVSHLLQWRCHQDGEVDGALFGFPIAVKDCFCTKGIRTTVGSLMLADYVPSYDATVVQRLLNGGTVLMGKTNMDEFGMGASSTTGHFGPVKNPWTLMTDLASRIENDWYISGGSSGGSAAAVACGVVKIALGSDTGGSTRNPAAFCGTIGYKPTYGLLSRHGLVPLVNAFDTPGILARRVPDILVTMDLISGQDLLDSVSVSKSIDFLQQGKALPTRKIRIGIPKEFYPPALSEDVLRLWKSVASMLEREAGCQLVEVSLPHTQFSIVCYHVLGEAEIASNMARYDGIEYGYRSKKGHSFNNLLAVIRQTAFNEVVRRRVLAGNYFLYKENYKKFYEKAAKVRRLIFDDYQRVFQQVDLLLTPATNGDAPLHSHYALEDNGYERERQDDFYTQPANLAGIPAVVVPVGLSRRHLPIGLQLMTNHFQDSLMLSMADWLNQRIGCPSLNANHLIDQLSRCKVE